MGIHLQFFIGVLLLVVLFIEGEAGNAQATRDRWEAAGHHAEAVVIEDLGGIAYNPPVTRYVRLSELTKVARRRVDLEWVQPDRTSCRRRASLVDPGRSFAPGETLRIALGSACDSAILWDELAAPGTFHLRAGVLFVLTVLVGWLGFDEFRPPRLT
jgi:hypothetical protein